MAVIKGHRLVDEIDPAVKLVTSTNNPVGTLVSMWIGSRYDEAPNAEDVQRLYDEGYCLHNDTIEILNNAYPEYATSSHKVLSAKSVIENVFKSVIKSNLPPLDAINFTFEINNASVAWREQLVRSRLPQNFWTQSSRTTDLENMDITRLKTIREAGGAEAVKIYDDTIETIREAYAKLKALGVPEEDIRLIPQGQLHRVYWMCNYRTLQGVISKRLSWIAQPSLWSPVILEIMKELRKKEPDFADTLGVPTEVKYADGKITSYAYDSDNEDRYYGRDSQPCDPLWLAYRNLKMPESTDREAYRIMKNYYINLWNQDLCDILGWDKNNPEILGPYDC